MMNAGACAFASQGDTPQYETVLEPGELIIAVRLSSRPLDSPVMRAT